MLDHTIRRSRWLPRLPTAAAAARLYLIPYSGCGASMYRRWPHRLRGVEHLPVELPGHETRFAEPGVQTYGELAALMVEGLAPYLGDGVPFGFFGHCGSALAAYEVTAELVRSGGPVPAGLFVSSEVAPQDGPAGRFLGMDDAELATELEKLIGELGETASPELVELYLEVLRADIEVNKRYVVPEPMRLPCPITAIGWTEDVEIPHATMGGWSACGETTSVLLDGRHHAFIEAPPDLLALVATGLGVSA